MFLNKMGQILGGGVRKVVAGVEKLGGANPEFNKSETLRLKEEIENNFIRLGYSGEEPGRNTSAIEAIKSSLYGLPNADLYDVLVNKCEQSIAGYKIGINNFMEKYLSDNESAEPLDRINTALNKAWEAIVAYEKTILK